MVWHIREPLAHGVLGIRRAWLRHVIHRAAARVVAISQHDADQLKPSERIRVVYNFVDFAQFDRSLKGRPIREGLGISADAPVLVMLGGVAPPKGTIELVRALPYLVESVPGIRVIVAGPPPMIGDTQVLKHLAKRVLRTDAYDRAVVKLLHSYGPDVQAALCFVGIRQDIPQLLAASDCLIFPSVVPHFARPIIEAAAMAKPSVASDPVDSRAHRSRANWPVGSARHSKITG
jgi:glycosyltransferase involved in cell wall biosynthesis